MFTAEKDNVPLKEIIHGYLVVSPVPGRKNSGQN